MIRFSALYKMECVDGIVVAMQNEVTPNGLLGKCGVGLEIGG
jgi:hypothetical protein